MSTAIAPETAAPASYTARVLRGLQSFATGSRGHQLWIDIRSPHGIGHSTLQIDLPVGALPLPMLDALRDGDGLRIAPVTRAGAGGQLVDLCAVFTCWKPATRFDATTGWRHAIAPEAQARIAAALEGFPLAPALLIDGGPELVGVWPLDRPLPVDRDPARTVALLRRLAEHLGADVETDLSATLPFCGVIRNWNATPPDRVDLVDVHPGRTYSIDDIETALVTATGPGKRGRP